MMPAMAVPHKAKGWPPTMYACSHSRRVSLNFARGQLDPTTCFAGVSSPGPPPQSLEDGMVHFGKGLLARHMPMIVGPTADHRVELYDQSTGRGLPVDPDDLSDSLQECGHVLP